MLKNHNRRTFSSPAEAVSALVQAAHNEDEPALEAILGAGKEVTSSSDEEEDKLEREQFCQKYQEMHRLVREPNGSTVLYIGAENWPFPIPLVSKNGEWYFDSDPGKQEILFRRIGENETTAIEVCEEFAMAKNASEAKAASEDPDLLNSCKAWSPLARRMPDNKESNPFHGYYFRIVTRNSASRGAADSKNEGKCDSGRISRGVPVLRGHDLSSSTGGIVYEKDLGPNTTTVAPKIKAPTGSSWHPAA